jgi:hypothetical protein
MTSVQTQLVSTTLPTWRDSTLFFFILRFSCVYIRVSDTEAWSMLGNLTSFLIWRVHRPSNSFVLIEGDSTWFLTNSVNGLLDSNLCKRFFFMLRSGLFCVALFQTNLLLLHSLAKCISICICPLLVILLMASKIVLSLEYPKRFFPLPLILSWC